MKKLVYTALLSVAVSFSASAQGVVANDRLIDNSFVEAGVGFSTMYFGGSNGNSMRPGLAFEMAVGKWLAPEIGVRAGYQTGFMSPYGAGNYRFTYIHGDVMMNARNVFGGYAPGRIWNISPYFHAGYLASDIRNASYRAREFAIGAGLFNTFRLADRLDMYLDIRPLIFKKDEVASETERAIASSTMIELGLAYNLGKTSWGHVNGVINGDAYDKDKTVHGDIMGGPLSNMFYQAGAGVSGIMGTEARGVSPSFDFNIGKWFNSITGARIGVQGFKQSFNDIQKGYYNVHAEVLINFRNLVAGYKADRFWNINPYVGAGVTGLIHNEAAIDAGVLNTFDMTGNLHVFADFRATISNARLVGNAGGVTGVGAVTAGVYYTFSSAPWKKGDVKIKVAAPTKQAAAKKQQALNASATVKNEHFFDNSFVQFGAGVNTLYSIRKYNKGLSFRFSPAVDLAFGKWISPALGMRVGAQVGYMSPKGETYAESFVHGDVLFDARTVFAGYRPGRIWNIAPYLHFGLLSSRMPSLGATTFEFAGGVGLLNTFRLSDKFNIFADLRPMLFKRDIAENPGEPSSPASQMTVAAGISYNFGRTEWGTVKKGSVKGSALEKDGASTSGEVFGRFIDNTFIQTGGGLAFENNGGKSFNVDLAAGKWITPVLGGRIGFQGFEQVKNGRHTYLYMRGDILVNFNNLVAGYKADRFWNIAPYIGAGVSRQISNEFTADAGLLNTFRFNDRMGAYLDLRLAVSEGRLHGLSGGAALNPAAMAGIYFNLGNVDWHNAELKVVRARRKDTLPRVEKKNAAVVNERFIDNTFFQFGAGVNCLYRTRYAYNGFSSRVAPALEMAIGKWITPIVGVRAGFETGSMAPKAESKYSQFYAHGDVLLNADNIFLGYRPARFWNAVPYAHIGVLGSDVPSLDRTCYEIAAGVGLLNTFRINEGISAYLDLRPMFFKQDVASGSNQVSSPVSQMTASVGLIYNFGRTEWGIRERGTVRGSEYEKEGDKTEGSIIGNFMDNTFIQGGAGLAYAPSVGKALNVEAAAGKWITPGFGVRVGLQGINQKNSKGNIPYYYPHGDVLLNINNLIAGYKADRFWTLAPYASAGLTKSSWNEFTVGGGLMNFFRFDDNMGAYLDLRVAAAQGRLFSRAGGVAGNVSVLAGLYFNIGDNSWKRAELSIVNPRRTSNKRAQKEGVVLNINFFDNTFVQVGGGVNALFTTKYGSEPGTSKKVAPSMDVALGKWFTPSLGLRLGYSGVRFAPKESDRYFYSYFHSDVLLDVRNLIAGYKPDRFWSIAPYVHGGLLSSYLLDLHRNAYEFAGGVGLMNSFRIHDRMNAYLDIRPLLFKQDRDNVTNTCPPTALLSATAGLSYTFGRSEWGSTRRGRVRGAARDIDGDQTEGVIENKFFDNLILTVGAGATKANQGGRPSVNVDLGIAKWVSPSVGVRLGFQGIQQNFSNYSGSNLFFLAHGDLMFNMNNIIAGYKDDRFWNIAPYISGGLSHMGANEFTFGAGIFNTFRITHDMGLFADVRATANQGRLHSQEGLMYNLSAFAGIYFNIGANGWNKANITVKKESDDARVKLVPGFIVSDKFMDNTFVQVGGGLNGLYTHLESDKRILNKNVSPSFEAAFGKMLSQHFSVRAGYQGGRLVPSDRISANEKSKMYYLHGDVIWNMNNTFAGYKPDRFWNIAPYLHLGAFIEYRAPLTDAEYAGGLGIYNTFRLNDNISLYADLRGFLLKTHSTRAGVNIASTFASANFGVAYNFGQQRGWSQAMFKAYKDNQPTNFDKPSIFDNTFVSVGAGVNTGFSPHVKLGFNGIATPSLDVSFGKWLSHSLGFRLGYQGFTISQWGRNPGSIVMIERGTGKHEGQYKETAGYGYAHADLLLNVRNAVHGYSRARIYEPIPYVGAGVLDLYSLTKSNPGRSLEYALSAGITNNFRLSNKVYAFVDLRATTYNDRKSLDKTGFNYKLLAFSFDLSAVAGLSFNIGAISDYGFTNPAWVAAHQENLLAEMEEQRAEKAKRTLHYSSAFWKGLGANTFATISGGVSMLCAQRSIGFNGKLTPAMDLSLGKWVNPALALRIGVQGGNEAMWIKEDLSGQGFIVSQSKSVGSQTAYATEGSFDYVHGDILWNMLNTFRYDPSRRFSLMPYAHTGIRTEKTLAGTRSKTSSRDIVAGLGLITSYRVADKASVQLDFRAVPLHNERVMASASSSLDGYAGMANAMLGITYDIGRTDYVDWGYSYVSTQENAGFFDKTFVSLGFGLNKRIKRKSGIGSALDISVGKWLSPNFGIRLGYHGLDYSRDYTMNYIHGDALWHLWNSLFKDEDKVYNLIPYAHAGLLITDANKGFEFAGGLGLLNNFTFGNGFSTFVDIRGIISSTKGSIIPSSHKYDGAIAGIVGMNYEIRSDKPARFSDAKCRVDDPEGNVARRWAISTNIVDYADMGTFNAEVQYGVSRHISLDSQVRLNAWTFGNGGNMRMNQRQVVALGAKVWPWYLYSGVWFRGAAQFERYREAKKLMRFDKNTTGNESGDKYGAALSLGYSLMVCDWFNVDFGLGVWGGYKNCVQYQDRQLTTPLLSMPNRATKKFFFEPNEFSISATFVF